MKNFLNPKHIYRFYKKAKKYYLMGEAFYTNPYYIDSQKKLRLELSKETKRTQVINYILSLFERDTTYLEIGVRNPDDNFNHIGATKKYAVDPGIEFEQNPVDFQLTSDVFFEKLRGNEILSSEIRFDVIFIDGLHLAEQVDRDIKNAIDFIKDDGFIVLHDCNPPTEWHARYEYNYKNTPARGYWNGTTWKAFLKYRTMTKIQSCCIDSDWGIGILSKKHLIGQSIDPVNEFYEINYLTENRKEILNLISFTDFKSLVNKKTI